MAEIDAHVDVRRGEPSPVYRWLVLIVISIAMFGNYYVYDSIAPIADMLKSGLGFSDSNIGWLYSAYSWAAVIVLLLGGVIIDRFGTVKSTIVFGGICTFAAILNAVTEEFWVMVVARFLLGMGSEPLIVAVTTALAKWFKGKELSFAFGVNLMIARMGSVAADWSPTWAGSAYETWQGPLAVAAGLGVLCLIAPIGYGGLEARAQRRYGLGKAGETDKLVMSDLFVFSKSFWFVVALCVTFYSAIFPFRSFAIKFFIESWEMTREVAGQANSVLPLAAMLATPLFGLLVDRLGKRALFMMVGALLLMPVYVMMAYHLAPLGVPIAMMGIAFSLIPAVMWPAVAYIVEEKRLGTAYAVMTLIQQIGVAGMNWLIGSSNDTFHASAANPIGYAPGMWAFSILGFLALFFAILLRRSETGPNAFGLETITAGDSGRFKAALVKTLAIASGFSAISIAAILGFAERMEYSGVLWLCLGAIGMQLFLALVGAVVVEWRAREGSWAHSFALYVATWISVVVIGGVLYFAGGLVLQLISAIVSVIWGA
ncbi:MAG: major facilitator superfamily domain-containing protein 1 [bacterium]|nr:major facilitator superfamily domain-containing protein 1 [bacterium]